MRLTIRTNLAIRTLMFCAVNSHKIVRKHETAVAINASENHLAQVINQLGQAGFITTMRGRNGGFHLARPAADISIGAVFRAFEAGPPFMECFPESDVSTCPLKPVCRMRNRLVDAVEAFYATLDPMTIEDLVACNTGLEALLSVNARPAPACPKAALALV
jgi:Rrf2 family nitric oxide-sensitive transcriptional repressor